MAPAAARSRPTRARAAGPRAAGPRATERTKVLSVRLTDEEFELLVERAMQIGVGPSTLARTLVRSGLHLDTPLSPLEQQLQHRLVHESPQNELEHVVRRVAALESRLDELAAHPDPTPVPNPGPRPGGG